MRYLVAVGANCGDRRHTLEAAWALLPPEIIGCARSPLFATAPVAAPRYSGAFLNGAWVVESAYGPHHLLWHLLTIEQRLGRVRNERNGPRSLDLDLIMAQEFWRCDSPWLTLPHPRAHRRRFVLEPAVTIAADWWHPQQRCTLAACLAACPEDTL